MAVRGRPDVESSDPDGLTERSRLPAGSHSPQGRLLFAGASQRQHRLRAGDRRLVLGQLSAHHRLGRALGAGSAEHPRPRRQHYTRLLHAIPPVGLGRRYSRPMEQWAAFHPSELPRRLLGRWRLASGARPYLRARRGPAAVDDVLEGPVRSGFPRRDSILDALNVDTRRRLERLERANTGYSPTDQLRLWPRLRNCATAGSSRTRFRRGLRVSSPTIA